MSGKLRLEVGVAPLVVVGTWAVVTAGFDDARLLGVACADPL